jgi:hypothetical protein
MPGLFENAVRSKGLSVLMVTPWCFPVEA